MISPWLSDRLKRPELLTPAGYIAGIWQAESENDRRFDVTNPASGEVLAQLPDMGPSETASAISAAAAAQPEWAARTASERGTILRRLRDLMLDHIDDLASIITAEMGKPLAEAQGEVRYGAAYLEWYAEEAKRIYGETIPGHQRDKRLIVLRQPVGVVGAITPWNFPVAMVTRKIAPALAAGCTVVLKPADLTPLSALFLARLAGMAGLPEGTLSVIPSLDGPAIGREMCDNPLLRKITFTGSTEVGRILMRQGAGQIKKLSLELGGNAPFIVFDDADPDAAVEGALQAKFRNNGQTCVCANRMYVQSGIYNTFAQKLTEAVAALKTGCGFDPGSDLGPLINGKAVEKVEVHVADACMKGAKVLTGGTRGEGLFYNPTVLGRADSSMLLAREETFGPVAALFPFGTDANVIRMANDTEFGLAAYFFSRDLARVWRVAEALEYGMVGINTGLISTEVAPFGGIKQSGSGREGSHHGISDYLDLKYLCIGGI